jgi:hypothetical protein
MEDVIQDKDKEGFTLNLNSKSGPFRKGIKIRVFKSNQAVYVRISRTTQEMEQWLQITSVYIH